MRENILERLENNWNLMWPLGKRTALSHVETTVGQKLPQEALPAQREPCLPRESLAYPGSTLPAQGEHNPWGEVGSVQLRRPSRSMFPFPRLLNSDDVLVLLKCHNKLPQRW